MERVDLVGGALQIHGLEASPHVVIMFLEPTSSGVDDGFTTLFGPEHQLRRSEVTCHASLEFVGEGPTVPPLSLAEIGANGRIFLVPMPSARGGG